MIDISHMTATLFEEDWTRKDLKFLVSDLGIDLTVACLDLELKDNDLRLVKDLVPPLVDSQSVLYKH